MLLISLKAADVPKYTILRIYNWEEKEYKESVPQILKTLKLPKSKRTSLNTLIVENQGQVK